MLSSPQVGVTKREVVELSFHRTSFLDVVHQSWILAKDDEVEPPCLSGENSQVTHRLLGFFFFFFGCMACAGSHQWECRGLTSEQPANSLLSFLTTSFPSSMRQESADGMLTCLLCSMLPFDKATTSLEIAGSSQGPTSD